MFEQGAVRSLWAASAEPLESFPSLSGEVQADIAIIGGGFTGLSAAHHLATDGLAPVVVEATSVGWGASGRNGGYVSVKSRAPLARILPSHGRDIARRLHALGHEAVDCVEQMIETCGIVDSGFRRYGHLTGALDSRAMRRLEASAAWAARELRDSATRILSRAEVTEAMGSAAFVGGSLNVADGGVHPVKLLRGLARDLRRRNIRIYERSPALRVVDAPGGVRVETAQGTVRARSVIYATNGYSNLTPAPGDLARRIIPFRSAAIATAPLSAALAARILPAGYVGSDSKRVLRWFRMVDGRMVFGGRGAQGSDGDSAAAYDRLRSEMVELFPALADAPVEFRWSGLVAMTMDFLPHIGKVGDRRFYALGYNGTGVALSHLMGRYLARLVRRDAVDLPLIGDAPFQPVPFYNLRTPAVRAATAWFQLLDGLGV
jgi:glycine/D-amino acid oxidase-like deaminating enzyme